MFISGLEVSMKSSLGNDTDTMKATVFYNSAVSLADSTKCIQTQLTAHLFIKEQGIKAILSAQRILASNWLIGGDIG